MTAYDLARAIYERHRAARPGPRWEELTLLERKRRTEQARRLGYARLDAPEVAIVAAETTKPATFR